MVLPLLLPAVIEIMNQIDKTIAATGGWPIN